jgi:hypothetical protein
MIRRLSAVKNGAESGLKPALVLPGQPREPGIYTHGQLMQILRRGPAPQHLSNAVAQQKPQIHARPAAFTRNISRPSPENLGMSISVARARSRNHAGQNLPGNLVQRISRLARACRIRRGTRS